MNPYVKAALHALAAGDPTIAPWLTDRCPECGDRPADPAHHVLYQSLVLVGCEGYHVINPNALGLDAPNWCDWTEE